MDPLFILALVCGSLVALYGIREGVLILANGGSRPEGTAYLVLSPVAGLVTFFVVAYLIVFLIALLIFIVVARAMAG